MENLSGYILQMNSLPLWECWFQVRIPIDINGVTIPGNNLAVISFEATIKTIAWKGCDHGMLPSGASY
jgi:hypothetical protein